MSAALGAHVERRKAERPLAALEAEARVASPPRGFADRLARELTVHAQARAAVYRPRRLVCRQREQLARSRAVPR